MIYSCTIARHSHWRPTWVAAQTQRCSRPAQSLMFVTVHCYGRSAHLVSRQNESADRPYSHDQETAVRWFRRFHRSNHRRGADAGGQHTIATFAGAIVNTSSEAHVFLAKKAPVRGYVLRYELTCLTTVVLHVRKNGSHHARAGGWGVSRGGMVLVGNGLQ